MIPKQIDKHLRILGLDSSATFSQVKEARVWYTKAFHPDRFPKGSKDAIKAGEKQTQINLAFEQLKEWFEAGADRQSPPEQPHEHDSPTHTTWFDELSEYIQHLEASEKAETTLRNAFCDLQLFADWLFAQQIESTLRAMGSERTIVRYTNALSRRYRPATVARHLYSIRGWLLFAKVDARCIVALASQFKAQITPQTKTLTKRQLTKFLEDVSLHANLDEQTMIHFLAHTGLTAGELCLLRWKDVSFVAPLGSKQKYPALEVFGRSGQRQIPLNELSMHALARRGLNGVLPKGGKAMQNHVFLKDGEPLTPKMVHYTIDRYSKIAGVKATPSILRHTFAKNLVSGGVPRLHLAQLLGVSEQSATVYYPAKKVTASDLIAAASKG